ncbi:MAG: sensor histidine kinase [Flavobacteriales bacterium]|nr:sensor histidine kinase [Flavobacteriales bacterium]
MQRFRPIPLIVLLAGTALPGALRAAGQAPVDVDSVLAIPYNDMVRDLELSSALYRRALEAAEEQGRTDALGHLHRQRSIVMGLAGSIDSAVHHGLRAVEHFRERNDRRMLGVMLCDLGHGIKRRDLDRAFAFYREGVPVLEGLNARQDLTRAYNNFSMLFEIRGDIDSALIVAHQGLVLVEALHDSTGLPYALNRVAQYLLYKERFAEARDLVMRADTIRRLTNDVHGMAEQRLYFGDLYQAWGKVPEAIAWFSSAIPAARAVKVPYQEQYAQERLAELYELRGDARAALEATRRAFAIKDSIFNERNSRTILELEQRYAVAEKDRAIAHLEAEAARRQLYIWLGLGALVLLTVSGLLLHQMRQRRARAERDAAIIAEREAGLRAVFAATEAERGRLARELHDGVGQQLGGLKHRLEAMQERAPVADVIHIVDDTSREVRSLAHQMMPRALERLGLVPALEEMVQRSFHGTAVKSTFEHFGMDRPLPQETATGLYRIAQELIGNVLKHARATTVDIQLLRNKQHLVLMVQDNGIGYTAGTGQGMGLMNITDRSRALGGTYEVESTPGSGTLSTVRIPAAMAMAS